MGAAVAGTSSLLNDVYLVQSISYNDYKKLLFEPRTPMVLGF